MARTGRQGGARVQLGALRREQAALLVRGELQLVVPDLLLLSSFVVVVPQQHA